MRWSSLFLSSCFLSVAACGGHAVNPGSAGSAPASTTSTTQGTSSGGTTNAPVGAGGGSTNTPTTAAPSGATPATPTDPVTAPVTPSSGASPARFLFSAYKDVTINANWNTGEISTMVGGVSTPVVAAGATIKAVTWSFATGECGSETWGGMAASQIVSANVASWAAAGKKYVLATGGAGGSFTCGSDAGFATFLDRYASSSLVGVDFDIEAGQSAQAVQDLVARVKAAQTNPKYRNLRFSFTLATLGGNASPSLGAQGVQVMQAIAAANLSGVYINLMAMDYGAATASNCVLAADGSCNMGASAVQAAEALNASFHVPLANIELTPMIGGNDTPGETFTLEDVATVSAYVKKAGLGGVHFWSLDRDNDCSQSYASPTCNSYGKAGAFGFLNAFTSLL